MSSPVRYNQRDSICCGAQLKSRFGRCHNRPVKGKRRCRLHGGASTGPKTPEGKATASAAMQEGRRRWLEHMKALKAEGKIKRMPMGRRSGPGWKTQAMYRREWSESKAERLARQAAQEPAKRKRGRPTKMDTLTAAMGVDPAKLEAHAASADPRMREVEQYKSLAKMALERLRQ